MPEVTTLTIYMLRFRFLNKTASAFLVSGVSLCVLPESSMKMNELFAVINIMI